MDFDISNFSLFERQSRFYNGSQCVYCNGYCDFVDSIEIYKHTNYGMAYWCRSCNVWVGTHRGNDQSLGTVASKELRELRHTAHQKFDPICAAKVLQGAKKKAAKAAGYNWLSKVLEIDPVTCHIGYFNIEQCKKVIEACDKVYEDIALKNEMAKFRKDICLFLAGEIGYEVKEFEMNGLLQVEMINHNGNRFTYLPKKEEGKWHNDKKFQPVADIEKFIYSNFK